ncbi:MAG: demethylmenaquinone methyltransferase/2-methoxy-6-polyprenyl-1,4-benzoquinol methylase, partial [Myxococcota bacterium]
MNQTGDAALGSGAMFDSIAPKYDRLNRMMSFGMDGLWRRRLVASLKDADAVLDLATGTGDVARALLRANPERTVLGVDPSVGMLGIGRTKLAEFGDRVRLLEGVAEALPLPDSSVDGVCIAFGIRNVPDRLAGLREMVRVCRPGGTIAVLELGEPRRGLL